MVRNPFAGLIERFERARAGSIAPAFAVILTFALAPTVAVGLDVARAMTGRNNLQDAVDAAGLAVAHLPVNSSQATVTATAQAWLNANLHDGALGPVTLTVTPSTQQVVIQAQSSITTTLGSVGSFAGLSSLPISASSTVKWGMNHIELAMVLDNTGSMSDDNKLSSLVSAATSLVSTLLAQNSNDPSAVKIAIVPFSNTVNVGTTYGPTTVGGTQSTTPSWIDPTASAYAGTAYDIFATNPYNGAAVNRFTLLQNMGLNWGGCVETRPQWVGGVDKSYDINADILPSSTAPGTQFVPYFAPDEPDGGGYYNNYMDDGQPPSGWNWNDMQGNPAKYFKNVATTAYCNTYDSYGNCKTTKPKNQTLSPAPSTGATALGLGYNLGPNFGCGVTPLLRLTTSASALNAKLGQMVATGDTYVPLGLFWGWEALAPHAPFNDGVAYGTANVSKIVIILTDGANHSVTGANNKDNSLYSGVGYQWQKLITTNAGSYADPGLSMNDREAKICANMKAQGIIIYAVPVEVTDATAKSLLQGCASSSDKYIDVTSSSQLQQTFTNIAGSISALRIAN